MSGESIQDDNAGIIAADISHQNDRFRANLGPTDEVKGKIVTTAAVSAQGPDFVLAAMKVVARFDMFTEDNDPYGWHDFGAFQMGGEKLFWKIDFYSDEHCEWGSEKPENPAQTYRILTIMFAADY